jgi:hypothetical protein
MFPCRLLPRNSLMVPVWEGREYHISIRAKHDCHLASNLFWAEAKFPFPASQSKEQEVASSESKENTFLLAEAKFPFPASQSKGHDVGIIGKKEKTYPGVSS